MNKYLLYIAATAVLTACSGTKNLSGPDLRLPSTLTSDSSATDTACVADIEWWEFYGDPALKRIIGETLENNRDILIAAQRVEQLRQLYGVEKLNYLPTISAQVYGNRETNDYHGEAFKPDPEYGLKGSVRWEADLWGGLSHAQKRAAATYEASVMDKRAMEMTLISEAATAYFNLAALQSELEIVKRTLLTRQEALGKTKLRFEGGMTSEIVYQQAKVELATTSALVPNLERRITLAKNAITLLMGRYPGDVVDAAPLPLNEDLAEKLPVGVPSQLLERRPDLRSSELKLRSAMASVGVAYSDQFPKITIGLTGGWENDEVANLLKSPFSYIVGNIAGTIFDFGRNRRKYKASIAAYEQARLAYEKAVLTAFTEVDNAVAAHRKTREAVALRKELRDAALKYVDLANKQYIGGTINYIDVLDAHRRYFDAQTTLTNAVRDEYLAIVALYKALGGGCAIDGQR